MRLALAGAGAFGGKHLAGLSRIEGVSVTSIVDPVIEAAAGLAARYGVDHVTAELDEVLERDDIDAVILATPTPLHAAQAIRCLDAGKHVEVEIPMADNLPDAEALLAKQNETGLVAMAGHTRRYNPSHQYLHGKIQAGEIRVQHMDVKTYFLRRSNLNAKGESRTWTDHLLWHHAAHTIDLFAWQTGPIIEAQAMRGPIHPILGIAMDMSIQLKAETGAICTLSLSFNNDGPFGTAFRYICDAGTWIARYDELKTGESVSVDVSSMAPSMDGIELQDRAFITAIRDRTEPPSSIAQVMPCYRILAELDRKLSAGDDPSRSLS